MSFLHFIYAYQSYCGIIEHLLSLTSSTAQGCTIQRLKSPSSTVLRVLGHRRRHLVPVLCFISHRTMAVVAKSVAVVVKDSLAHAMHDDGAVDHLSDGGDPGKSRVSTIRIGIESGKYSRYLAASFY